MTTRSVKVTAAALFTALLSVPATAAESVGDALVDGTAHLDGRYRYETVDQNGLPETAQATTLRLRFGYTTGDYLGWKGMLEYEDVRAFPLDDYNSTKNGLTDYPVVADPEDTELNRAWVQYAWGDSGHARFGRQRIKLDNDRFVGNVGFRQNEQTFTGLTVNTAIGDNADLFYGHIEQVNRIFGAHHPNDALARTMITGELLNGQYDFGPLAVTGYGYLLEFDDAPQNSNQTLGLRLASNTGKNGPIYQAEFATQSDYRDGAAFIDADYMHGRVGWALSGHRFFAGYELLGGDGTYAFQTPLATLHAFNGWADKFLTTPATGLEDVYAGWSGSFGKWGVSARYHEFASDTGGLEYGSEVDLAVSRALGSRMNVKLELADYDAEQFATDTTKIWLSLGISL